MNYVLRFHFVNSFKEWVLPEIDNQSLSLSIDEDISNIKDKIQIKLNVFDGQWYLCNEENYKFTNSLHNEVALQNGDLINAEWDNCKFNITFHELNEQYLQFNKYWVTDELITIGRPDYENKIAFDYENNVSGHHAELKYQDGVYGIYDKSRNGTYVNGKRGGRYKEPRFLPLKYGDEIYIFGLKIIYLGDTLAINKNYIQNIHISLKEIDNDNSLNFYSDAIDASFFFTDIYDRSPRKANLLDIEQVNIENPPNPSQNKRSPLFLTIGPSLTMVIPMIAGVLFTQWSYSQTGTVMNSAFMYMGIITSVTSAIIGVSWALINTRYAKKQADEAETLRVNGYKSYINKTENLLKEKKEYNLQTLNDKYSTSQECINWILEKNHRLWENNNRHDDFLTVRIGQGKITNPNPIIVSKERFSLISDPLQEEPYKLFDEYKEIDNAPILLSFIKTKLLGLVGEKREDLLKTITVQLVCRYAYNEVKIAYLYSSHSSVLNDLKWIPHTWSDNRKIRLIAENLNECREILYFISSEIRNRTENKSEKHPYYIIFVEKSELLEDESLIKRIISEELGISMVFLSQNTENLPNECNEIIEDDQIKGYYFLDEKAGGCVPMSFDYVVHNHFVTAMRRLSNYRVKEEGSTGSIPDMITYFDMIHVGKVENLNIYRHWLENRSYESMRSLIGLRAGNQPVYLDVHEKVHGPHGLIAGTTGSGKSELLQTYILSLALNYHPYEVSFILIDYKGGGMAQSFEKLPHTSGIITNLSGNQTNRALIAINSEIRRRQHIFNENHIKHIDEYIELFRSKKTDEPIPHLIIIADEFAELKKEQPDFVKQLVSASRIGRSLGVHLILATQKPNGVVDDEIWGNSKFRVCLRVQDRQDSNDMLKRTDAAYITNVGRAYLQVGNNEIFEEFQSAWSGAKYIEKDESQILNHPVHMIQHLGKTAIVGKKKGEGKGGITQLDTAVNAIKKVFDDNHILPIRSVWLEPLKTMISLKDIEEDIEDNQYNMVLGIIDDPINQQQFPLRLNLIEIGNLLVCGGISGGKTTFLKTYILSLIQNNDADHLHIYIADFGSRTLNVFKDAPQIGDILFENDKDSITKLIKMLLKELNERKLFFSEKGIATFKEFIKKNDNFPAILFVIDNYLAFNESLNDLEESLFTLTREGAAYGIYMAVSCMSPNEIKSRIRSNFRTGIGIQLSDRFEYEAVLGEKADFMPEANISGRGLIKLDRCYEFQTALVHATHSSEENNIAIKNICLSLSAKFTGTSVPPVPKIPEDMSIPSFLLTPDVNELRNSYTRIPLGFDVNEISLVELDLSKIFCFTISGDSHTGKSIFTSYLAALKQGQICDMYAITDKPELKDNFLNLDVKECIDNSEQLYNFLQQKIVPLFTERSQLKVEYIRNQGHSVSDYLNIVKPIYILIDELPFFLDLVYNSQKNMSDFIELCFQKGHQHGIYFFGTMNPNDYQLCLQKPAFKYFIQSKQGIHYGGMTDQQRIFDFDLPISLRNKKLKPGYAFMNYKGKTIQILTPVQDYEN